MAYAHSKVQFVFNNKLLFLLFITIEIIFEQRRGNINSNWKTGF